MELLMKFGKKEHLEQIVKGNLRFTRLGYYREQENINGKGLGDAKEGYLTDHIDVENQENKMISCFSILNKENANVILTNDNLEINIKKSYIDKMEKDFSQYKYDAALLIYDKDCFEDNIKAKHSLKCGKVKYFNEQKEYPIYGAVNDYLSQYNSIPRGGLEFHIANYSAPNSININDLVFRKSDYYKVENEWRVLLDENVVVNENFYTMKFDFNCVYKFVDIKDLDKPIKLILNKKGSD